MTTEPILTAYHGDNMEVFPHVLRMYVPEGSIVADTTFGKGAFWRNVTASYDVRATDLRDGIDARALPYDPSSIDAVVFDPPYMFTGGKTKESLNGCYQNNEAASRPWKHVRGLYAEAIREARRVLRSGGILILKTQDTVVNHKQLWMHAELLSLDGFICEDLFVVVQKGIPLMSSTWKRQYHARKNHSYFLVHRKALWQPLPAAPEEKK